MLDFDSLLCNKYKLLNNFLQQCRKKCFTGYFLENPNTFKSSNLFNAAFSNA
jgi:hypothetical protein